MFSLIAGVCTAVGYLLFFFTDDMIVFPLILMIAAMILAIIDLTAMYQREKLLFSDFVKEAFRTNFGSTISVIAGLFFVLLCIINL